MTWLDYAVFGVIAFSMLWAAWRGLVREVISLAAWVIAFLAANLFAGPLSEVLPLSITSPELRAVVAFLAVFIGTLMVATLFALVLSRMIHAVGLGSLDRVLGTLFGLARGLLIVIAFALLAGLTALPLQPAWRDSFTGTFLAHAALGLKPWLPPAFAMRLRYH